MSALRKERADLMVVLEEKRKEIAESQDLHNLRQLRLQEASGELALAEVQTEIPETDFVWPFQN